LLHYVTECTVVDFHHVVSSPRPMGLHAVRNVECYVFFSFFFGGLAW
jgi:hypothetical protein